MTSTSDGVDDLHDALHHGVHPAPAVAGDCPVEGPDDQHQGGGRETHQHGDPGAHHDPHQDVPAVAVGAEEVGKDGLSRRLPLQLLPGVAPQPGLDAQLPADLGLAGRPLVLGGAGLGPDAGQVHGGEGLSPGLRFGEGLLHRRLRVGGGRAPGQLGRQALLVVQGVMPGVEVLRPGVELGIAVGDHQGPHKGEEDQEQEDS